MIGLIYKVTNKQNNKIYIGQTINTLNRRRSSHYTATKRHYGNSVFHKTLEKYPKDNFIWEIIETIKTNDKQELQNKLNERECYYIKFYDSNNLDKGYNLTSGGDSHQEQSKAYWNNPERSGERRQKLSQSMTEYWADKSHIEQHTEWMNNFYKTPIGQEQAKRHGDFMKNYYNGPNARKNKAKTAHYFVKAISPNNEEMIFISSKEPNLYFNKDICLRSNLHQAGDTWIPTKRSFLYGWKFEAIPKFEII